jgi:type VI secretion system protein VasG
MTSNAGTELITRLFADAGSRPDVTTLAERLQPELMAYFKPAFLGRVTLVPYVPLSPAEISKIVVLQLDRIAKRVADTYRASFEYSPAIVSVITARCTESASGARNIEKILSRTVLPELSGEILSRLAKGEAVTTVRLDVDEVGAFTYTVG